MTETTENEYRYLFTVRQKFDELPRCDAFYEIQVPAGITGEQAQIMTRLKDDFCKAEISADTVALQGMDLRIRFNADMYQSVCMVRASCELDGDMMDSLIQEKHADGTLTEWLDEAAIK